MIIDFNPSEKLRKKALQIFTLHEAGMSYREIAASLKHHKTWIVTLCTWHKKNIVEKEKNEK